MLLRSRTWRNIRSARLHLEKYQPLSSYQKVQLMRDAHIRERGRVSQLLEQPMASTQISDLSGHVRLSDTQVIAAESLWNFARLSRSSVAARSAFKNCIVGGAAAIKKIWHEYGVRPTCLFVPNDEPVPEWCLYESLPTLIVRAEASSIRHELLSAEFSDGFAAEFPMPTLPPLEDLVNPRPEAPDGTHHPSLLTRSLVLHQTRNASNVGSMMQAAVDLGFDSIVADRTADMFNEKVLRASQGAIFNPKIKVFCFPEAAQLDAVDVLQRAALAHRLMPVFAVPHSEAEPIFTVAQRFFYYNRGRSAEDSGRLGIMLLMGSEARGLQELQERWALPVKYAGIPLDNAFVNSINVSFAASVMMHHLRPRAAEDYEELFQKGLIPKGDDIKELGREMLLQLEAQNSTLHSTTV